MWHLSCRCITLNYSMNKKKIEIEHTLNSTSRNIVWQLIGTAEGLNRWIADDVKMNGKHIEFAWGDDWRHHETRQATLRAGTMAMGRRRRRIVRRNTHGAQLAVGPIHAARHRFCINRRPRMAARYMEPQLRTTAPHKRSVIRRPTTCRYFAPTRLQKNIKSNSL